MKVRGNGYFRVLPEAKVSYLPSHPPSYTVLCAPSHVLWLCACAFKTRSSPTSVSVVTRQLCRKYLVRASRWRTTPRRPRIVIFGIVRTWLFMETVCPQLHAQDFSSTNEKSIMAQVGVQSQEFLPMESEVSPVVWRETEVIDLMTDNEDDQADTKARNDFFKNPFSKKILKRYLYQSTTSPRCRGEEFPGTITLA